MIQREVELSTGFKKIRKTSTFPLIDALECACAAYRINGNAVVNYFQPYYEDGQPVQGWANRYLVISMLGYETAQNIVPPPKIEEDKALAQEIIQYYKNLVFKVIKGASDSLQKRFALLEKEIASVSDLSTIVYLPKTYEQDLKRDRYLKEVSQCVNEYIGPHGDRLNSVSVFVISCYPSYTYGNFAIVGIIDNKLCQFYYKTPLNLYTTYSLSGRIRSRKIDPRLNKNTTFLHYVKIGDVL